MLTSKPRGIPAPRRQRGTRALGLAYERKLARALPNCLHNPWFLYEDAAGRGYCCVDVLASWRGAPVVLECKLTNVPEALTQLRELYLPVVSLAFRAPARGVIVVKHATHVRSAGLPLCTSLEEALELPPEPIPALHWLGSGPL